MESIYGIGNRKINYHINLNNCFHRYLLLMVPGNVERNVSIFTENSFIVFHKSGHHSLSCAILVDVSVYFPHGIRSNLAGKMLRLNVAKGLI